MTSWTCQRRRSASCYVTPISVPTTRYVNPTKKALRRAVDKIEERNRRLANSLQKGETTKEKSEEPAEKSLPVSVTHLIS